MVAFKFPGIACTLGEVDPYNFHPAKSVEITCSHMNVSVLVPAKLVDASAIETKKHAISNTMNLFKVHLLTDTLSHPGHHDPSAGMR